MSAVVLDSVGKLYGETRAVDAVDLAIEEGEFLVLVGPSGCGKSTLLRMIAGLEEISEGELRLGGERANEKAPRDRELAMVFQSYALYPHMTARDNMSFGLRVRKLPPAEISQRVQEAARMLAIEELLDRLPRDMSGGQRQRVAMGRAAVRKPRVFLFDEPLSNLDAALRNQMRAELKRLHRELGVTMIYVTHDQVEAMTLADRIAVLNRGVLQQVGRPEELYRRPANRFVAGFIGTPSMNFLEGQQSGSLFRWEGAEITLPSALVSAEIRPLVIGLRPQHLRLAEDGALAGHIEVVEWTGLEAYLQVRVGESFLLVRVEGEEAFALKVGASVRLEPVGEGIRCFAPGESGAALN